MTYKWIKNCQCLLLMSQLLHGENPAFLPFCVPLLLAICQSWKNWLGIVVKLWIWSGSIICQFSHVPRRMHCKSWPSKLFTQVTSPSNYTAHQQVQLVNYVQAHQMFTIDLETLSLDWFCWENLQESPIFFMGKYLWFPVKIFPWKPIHWHSIIYREYGYPIINHHI